MSRHSSWRNLPLSQEVLREIHATQSVKPSSQFSDVSSPNLRLSRHSTLSFAPFPPEAQLLLSLDINGKKAHSIRSAPSRIHFSPPSLPFSNCFKVQSETCAWMYPVSRSYTHKSQPTEPHFSHFFRQDTIANIEP